MKKKLTAGERAEYVVCLRAAKGRLARTCEERARKDRFICWALAGTQHYAGVSLIDLVEDRLGGYGTLEAWLERHACFPHGDVQSDPDKVQATRHAWIDSLIAEFSPP